MTDSGFLVCGSPLFPYAPGSTMDECADCGATVVVAPSGRRRIAAHDLQTICMDCGERRMEADPDAEIAPVGADQLAEMLQAAHAENARRRRN